MGSAWDASSIALREGRYRLDSRRGVNHLRQICQDRGCSAILVRSQSRVAQRQSIRLLIGRLLVRIQPRELLGNPRPFRVGGFVRFTSGEPLEGHAGCECPCDDHGLARLRRAAFGRGDACARDTDQLGELALIEASGFACFAETIRKVKGRNTRGKCCRAHISKFSDVRSARQ